MNTKKKSSQQHDAIAKNKRAFHDYTIEDHFEAGIVLKGWEVKSLRQGRLQLIESYVHIKKNEAWLFNAIITPLLSASTHVVPNPSGTRKLLLTRREIKKLVGKIDQKGYTVVPISMYWKGRYVKVDIATAKGKQQHDKRQAAKDHDWKREKARLFKRNV